MESGVVVGIDQTPESWTALRWAAQESLFRNCPMRIVHVHKGHRRLDAYADAARPDDGQDVFDAAMGYAHSHLGVGWVSGSLVAGAPVSVLLAESAGAELLVVGSRHRSDAVASVLTSVSAALAWRGSCPVLVVRGEEPWRRVVVGVRSPDASESVLGFAFDEAYQRCNGLSVVHCFDESNGLEFGAEQRLADRLAAFEQKYPDVHVTTEFLQADPAEALIGRSEHAGLVVVGTSRHGGGPLTGSVSQRVLYGARGSVAVVREQ